MAVDITRLNSWLNSSKTQTTNNPLWQLLKAIIGFVQDNSETIIQLNNAVPIAGDADPNTVLHGASDPRFRQVATEDIFDLNVTTAKLSLTGVVAGSYTNTDLTVGVDGRLTAASNGSGSATTDYTNTFMLMGA